MAGGSGGGVAGGGDSSPSGRRRINISEMAKEEYLQDLERTSAIEAAKGAKRSRGAGDVSGKAAVRDALVISSSAIFLALIGVYGVVPQIWVGHFHWTNTITAVMAIGFSLVGLFLLVTSLNEVPSYIMKKVQLVFLVVVVIVAIPMASRFLSFINFNNAPLIFINMMLAVAVVGATFNHFVKERMAYFIVWWFGMGITTIAPLYEMFTESSGSGYGGLHKALQSAHGYGFDCVGLFVRNQIQWRRPPLGAEAVRTFRRTRPTCSCWGRRRTVGCPTSAAAARPARRRAATPRGDGW